MDSERERVRMNVEGDRLSSLPDDLIQKIFSLIGTKHAVQTSVLSSKWRFMWTSMACLDFSSEEFSRLPKFSKFVTHVLSNRNNQIDVYSVKLSFRGKASQAFVKKILSYAFSHNVQQLTVTCLLDDKKIVFPLSLFSSETLKHLYLVGSTNDNEHSITPTSTWELPALTTLHLDHVTLYDNNADNCAGLFSKCTNLMDLTLSYCNITTSNSFTICHPQLSNLSLENGDWGLSVMNVVAPQLMNLTIIKCDGEHLISAPELTFFSYESHHSFRFSTEGFPSLETLELCIDEPDKADAHKIVGVLQLFNYVKTLNLSLEIIEVLSSSTEVVAHQPSPFAKLTSLNIYPADEKVKKEVNMSPEVKKYLLDGSPSATFTIVSREDIRAMRNSILAQSLMAELRELLEQEKPKPNTADMHNERKPTVENQRAQPITKKQPRIEGKMKQIQNFWEHFTYKIQASGRKCQYIRDNMVSKLERIEGLLTNLPASKRAKIQASYSALCKETSIVMNEMMNRIRINSLHYQGRINYNFNELAKASPPSS